MKKPAMKLKFSRRTVNLLVICLLCGGALFAWQTIAELQTKNELKTNELRTQQEYQNRSITIHAAGRGNPFVNFTDGTDLVSSGNAINNNSQPRTLASADFDADGVEDLVTADAGGVMKYYHGIDLRRGDRETGRQGDTDPFESTGKSLNLNIAPDFLFTGDFNADGNKDILAASKGGNFLVLLSGNGRGDFSQPQGIAVTGRITAIQIGEIGRRDGQTDVAVATVSKKGAFLSVYEHPEGAFKHKPEIFKLPAPAADIAVGNLDDDFYADLAVACGSDLIIVHGRGQAYPWDLLPDWNIKRPAAIVASRKMPFVISALAAGRFGSRRGESLALLGQDGNLYRIEPDSPAASSKNLIPAGSQYVAAANPFVPSDENASNSEIISAPPLSREEAENFGLLKTGRDPAPGEISDAQKQQLEEQLENYKSLDKTAIERKTAETSAKTAAGRTRAINAFLKSIAAKPATLAQWNLTPLSADSQFTGAASSGNSQKILGVNVSGSGRDDILLVDAASNQLQIVSQINDSASKNQFTPQITPLETDGVPLAVLPLRLNLDALTDLVVLRQGASAPGVVLTAPSATLVVNSTNDDGECQPGNQCSLRNAIIYANNHSGVEDINFDFGGAATITPSLPLPTITSPVNIIANTGGNNQPDIVLSGVNIPAPANGLLLRTSDSTIYGLTISNFKSTISGQSQTGGSGIAIDSLAGSPVNGNNLILNNYLGTDRTGTADQGNDATGINIFTSDNNQIVQNLISGNGSQQKSGAGISVTAGNGNQFVNNIVGLNAAGTAKVPNSLGVFLAGANNSFGGDGAGSGNTVSGNGEEYSDQPGKCGGGGVLIPILVDLNTHELLSFGNTISGNRVGTNPAGDQGFGNCVRGIETDPVTGTVIGSITEAGRNIVSDNGYDAIWCGSPFHADVSEIGFCSIAGNNIGTDITGNISIRNDQRNIRDGANPVTSVVYIASNVSMSNVGSPGGTTPGGACTGFCNLISGNDNSPSFNSSSAVGIGGFGVIAVFNNYIGTNKSGTQALSNLFGVGVSSTQNYNYSPTYLVGSFGTQDGNPVSLGNLISGNSNGGVTMGVGGNTTGSYYVLSNKIGTDVSGTYAVPNGGYNGVFGSAVNVNTGFGYNGTVQIGDPSPLGRNIISGNGTDGINIFTGYNVRIVNNLIGLNSAGAPLGNAGNGISMGAFFGVGNVVGGGRPETKNYIRNNGKAGILIQGGSYFANNLRGNSIDGNGGLGIDLGTTGTYGNGDGVTANDCQDADSGPNGLQNFPLLDAPVINGSGAVKLTGALLSRPYNNYTIDFYASPAADPTNHGEGAEPIGSLAVKTDDHGLASIDFTSSGPVNGASVFSATATDIFGNTSEFSCNAGATCSDSFTALGGGPEAASNADKYEQMALSCFISEIVVNVDSDEADTPTNLNNNICDVDTATPDNQCTLRAAIQVAEHRAGYDAIKFNIPGAGVRTILPETPLPPLTTIVLIDGASQPGYAGTPLIKLDGGAIPAQIGLQLNGGGATITGLAIAGFNRGLSLNGQTNNKIVGCHIGINADGLTAPETRQDIGIDITNGSSNNQIGGTGPNDRNIISNNTTGIHFYGGANNNRIINNIIGGNISQTGKLPNGNGIYIDGSNNNQIGDDLSLPNYIFGNIGGGIVIDNSSVGNNISGNRIGVTQTDSPEFANLEHGIVVTNGASRNTIGGATGARGNIIGGHISLESSTGVLINASAGPGNRLLYNQIGVVVDSQVTIPNNFGVVARSSNQIIGRVATPNVIGGNQRTGVFVDGRTANVNETIIEGNRIGTDGSSNFGNAKNGIATEGDVTYSQIDRNLISGNMLDGILIGDGRFNTITGNRIGTNADGTDHLNNGSHGIFIRGGGNTIGGRNAADGNLISGNALDGIYIETGSNENKIYSNLIGTTANGAGPLGNGVNGIFLYGTKTEVIDNTVSANAKNGIWIERGTSDAAEQLNLIQANYIGTSSDGENPLGNTTGVLLRNGASNNTVLENIISANTANGVSIRRNSDANLIISNHIGTTTDGSNGLGNALSGVSIESSNNTVTANLISANRRGVFIAKTDAGAASGEASGNVVKGNKIGTDNNGDFALPNIQEGVSLTGGAFNNTIGGLSETDGNLISGNGDGDGTNGRGIAIFRALNTDEQTQEAPHENKIFGNYVGLNQAHDAALPNTRSGIIVVNSPGNIIGSNESPFARNVVAGNLLNGIAVTGLASTGNRIDYNYVGITPDGVSIGNNSDGINIDGAPRTIIGSNNVCGNSGNGIAVSNLNSSQLQNLAPEDDPQPTVTITGNRVGIFKGAIGVITKNPNLLNGMALKSVSGALIGATDNIETAAKNVVSGNNAAGIFLEGSDSADNILNFGIIGTDENGTQGIGNGGAGVFLKDTSRTRVGDPDYRKRLSIAGNGGIGVIVSGALSSENKIQNDFIGVDPNGVGLRNESHGVLISESASVNQVGGRGENEGNVIANNGGDGVRIDETAGFGNLVDPNAIFGNAGLGIDIGTAGRTMNDLHDADEGANRGQNYPELTSQINPAGELVVSYKVDSKPGDLTVPGTSNYGAEGLYIEFFKADVSGQGIQFLGFDHYRIADYNNGAPQMKQINLGSAQTLGITAADKITATATDADNNTSEFFPPFGPTAAGATIGGRVLTANGRGIPQALLTLTNPNGEKKTIMTNSFGYYNFENIPAGAAYVIGVSSRRYTFQNPAQLLSVTESTNTINFTALP